MIYDQCLQVSNFGNGSKMWLTAINADTTTLSDCYLPYSSFVNQIPYIREYSAPSNNPHTLILGQEIF